MISIQEISSLLEPYRSCILTSKLMTEVIYTVLKKNGIDCSVFMGGICFYNKKTFPHYWIKTNGYIIDFKARTFLGNNHEIPVGVFEKEKHKRLIYIGIPIEISPLSQKDFKIYSK